MLMDLIAAESPIERFQQLKICAIGAPVYRDIKIGCNHFPYDPALDYLKFRMYRVSHRYYSPNGVATVLDQIAKGNSNDAFDVTSDKSLFGVYWLG